MMATAVIGLETLATRNKWSGPRGFQALQVGMPEGPVVHQLPVARQGELCARYAVGVQQGLHLRIARGHAGHGDTGLGRKHYRYTGKKQEQESGGDHGAPKVGVCAHAGPRDGLSITSSRDGAGRRSDERGPGTPRPYPKRLYCDPYSAVMPTVMSGPKNPSRAHGRMRWGTKRPTSWAPA
jgi:hypothetical protein